MRALVLCLFAGCSHAPPPTEAATTALPAHREAPPPEPEARDDKGHTPSEWIALGDEAFVQTRFVDAERFYQEALRAGDPALSGYAFYKLAFIKWSQNDGPAALDAFVHAMRSPNAKIAAQAAKDIIPVYAQYARPEVAYHFFRNIGSDPAAMLARLQREYEDEGKPDAARKVQAQINAAKPAP